MMYFWIMSISHFINQIKSIATFVLILSVSENAYCQEVFTVDSIYENPSELLLRTKIIQFDSNQTAEALKTKFKNWAGLKFRNLNEVIVSETNEQIVLNYNDKYIWDAGFGGRMNITLLVRFTKSNNLVNRPFFKDFQLNFL